MTNKEREKEVKKAWEDGIEDFFTMQLIPGQKPLVDQNFNPEKLGERVADQMGESLVEFLPFMIAPNLIASSGPVQGFAQSVTMLKPYPPPCELLLLVPLKERIADPLISDAFIPAHISWLGI